MKIFWRTIGSMVLALAFLGSYSIVSMILDRDPPIRYQSAVALVPSVAQGGTIDIEFSVFRRRICEAQTRRWLYDAMGERHSIPQFTTGLELLAGRETYRRSITIPMAASPGPARYDVTLDYVCNPLQRLVGPIRVVSPPIQFEIQPAAATPVVEPADDGDG